MEQAIAAAGAEPDSDPLFDSGFLRKLERFEIIARKIFRGQLRGEHLARRRGHGIEVSDFRRYHPGDDFRHIDWNSFSRLDQLFVKLYASEDDLSLHLLLDVSASMGFGRPAKFDAMRRIAAALAYIGLANLDRVSLSAYSTQLGAGLSALKGRGHMRQVFRYLGTLSCAGETLVLDSAKALAGRLRSPGLVVVVSDFLGDDAVLSGLDVLRHRGHELIVIQLLDEDELAPPLSGALRLVDAETGNELRVTVDEALRAAYLSRLGAQLDGLETYCAKTGVDYLRATTAIPFDDLILRYLRQGRHFR